MRRDAELADARRVGKILELGVHSTHMVGATIKPMEMSKADRGCVRGEDLFAVPPAVRLSQVLS
jgi:hypothetical protein